MELLHAMRSVGTCRRFLAKDVPKETIEAAIEAARFGPQGGNRQPVRFIVVSDPQRKAKLGDLYQPLWDDYVGVARERAIRASGQGATRRVGEADRFARAFGSHPAIVVVCAHLPDLLATDSRLPRLSIVGGASVYPIVQNFVLALRDLRVASAITTLLCAVEPDVKELLAIPDDWATACHIAIGYPEKGFPRSLKRLPVDQLVFGDAFGAPLR